MLSKFIPVFLNGRPALMAPGSTLAELVAQEDPELAILLQAGRAIATDARGVAVERSAPLAAGAIFRVVRSARVAPGSDDA